VCRAANPGCPTIPDIIVILQDALDKNPWYQINQEVPMAKPCAFIQAVVLLASALTTAADGQVSDGPETVAVHNGSLTLRALLWRPRGHGPFPAVLLNHGSGRTPEELERLGPYERQADVLGPVFARHGYVFLYLFRRGVGLSADPGANAVDLMNGKFAARGQEARNELQLQLLENTEMSDARAGLAFLRALPQVNARDVALIGHSFGGSLTLLLAEREPNLRAVVVFSAAGYSWDRSPSRSDGHNHSLPPVLRVQFQVHCSLTLA
jgi:dienelactone hydrolase